VSEAMWPFVPAFQDGGNRRRRRSIGEMAPNADANPPSAREIAAENRNG
jgi:hypothetical protein